MFPDPNNIYLWTVAGVSFLVALNTLITLVMERHRLAKEDLSEDDRSLVWKIVIFVIFPLGILLELRSTIVATELLGGKVDLWKYGLLWYEALPSDFSSDKLLIPALFAGELMQGLFALSLIPALLFRPHPFLATVIGYTVAWIFGLNLIVEPILSCTGLAGNKWYLAFTEGSPEQRLPLIGIHLALAVIYLVVVRSEQVRLWFSKLTRPEASDKLRRAMTDYSINPDTARTGCRLGLMYDRAGLKRQAKRQLKRMKKEFGYSIYTAYLDAVVCYNRRDYKLARAKFVEVSNFQHVEPDLKASLLAAAACAAFAQGDPYEALNLSDRALEFDDNCLVARMVKVDAYLRQGKREQAAEEILVAMHTGSSLDLENKVPLDIEKTFDSLGSTDRVRAELALASAMRKT